MPPLRRYERYHEKDCVLLITAADNLFRTFEQAVSYYKLTSVKYIGFRDKCMPLTGGCGGTDGKPQIDKTEHLTAVYQLGKNIYK